MVEVKTIEHGLTSKALEAVEGDELFEFFIEDLLVLACHEVGRHHLVEELT